MDLNINIYIYIYKMVPSYLYRKTVDSQEMFTKFHGYSCKLYIKLPELVI